jgi:hypothetical protein
MDTDSVIKALAPVFACGFAVQQLIELLDPAITAIVKEHSIFNCRKRLEISLLTSFDPFENEPLRSCDTA